MALPQKILEQDWALTSLQVLGFATLTALAAKVSIFLPFSPVPITMQSLVVLLAGAALGSKKGALSQISLIGVGLLGLPVFSLPVPGYLVLAGPTSGYILGFVFAAFIMGRCFESKDPASFWRIVLFIVLAKIAIFIPGLLVLSLYASSASLFELLSIGLFPFLPGAVFKAFALLGILKAWDLFRS